MLLKKSEIVLREQGRTDFMNDFNLFPFVTSINSVQALSLLKDSMGFFSTR